MGSRAKRSVRILAVESLERRDVPATFGVPWHDAGNLTLSFAPDGTQIAGHTSSLFQTMNAQEPTAVWEQQVLKAFQTWAVQANINIGLVADSGDPFGVAGKSQHDSRFGDIRIGAQPMSPSALSISIPNDPSLSSTWTGDVLINSNDLFGGRNLNVFSVLLHEAGHVFGLPDGSDPNSPMNSQYTGAQALTPGDIKAIQDLYGVRAPDSHEGSSGNDTMNKATQVQPPGSYTGATPLVTYGDVTTNRDVDFYAVRSPSNYQGPMTFRVQSTGISLLAPRLTVFDARGTVVGDAQANSDRGDTVTIHLDRSVRGTTYYVRVQGATQDAFGIGSYGMAVTFDAANTVAPATLDTVLRGPYQALNPNDISALLSNPNQALINNIHQGDGVVFYTQLSPTPGYALNSHYETAGSLSTLSDVTIYRFQSAPSQNGQTLVLTATVRSLAPNGTVPRVTILDSSMKPIAAQVLANGNGTFSVQAVGVKASGNYFLKVSSNGSVGNYSLDAEFGTTPARLSTFAGGNLGASTAQKSYNFYVGENQLTQFVLSASGSGAPAGAAVQMTVLDKNGRVVATLTAAAGDTTSGDALFLSPGAYTLRFSVLGVTGGNPATVAYALQGEAISDPIGPVLDDPTLTPIYTSPTMPGFFFYPDGTATRNPFLIVPMVA